MNVLIIENNIEGKVLKKHSVNFNLINQKLLKKDKKCKYNLEHHHHLIGKSVLQQEHQQDIELIIFKLKIIKHLGMHKMIKIRKKNIKVWWMFNLKKQVSLRF